MMAELALGITLAVASYFIGNISPAILIGRMYGIDIKKEGSGNAGTTNVLRILGRKAAAATLVIDILKGVAAVMLGKYICGFDVGLICGVAVFCGHIWPVIFKFKGGKGVATALGVIITTAPVIGAGLLVFAVALIALSRRVSVGAVIAAFIFPFAVFFYDRNLMLWSIILAVIVLIKHRSNIKRLLKGEEPKLNFKK